MNEHATMMALSAMMGGALSAVAAVLLGYFWGRDGRCRHDWVTRYTSQLPPCERAVSVDRAGQEQMETMVYGATIVGRQCSKCGREQEIRILGAKAIERRKEAA